MTRLHGAPDQPWQGPSAPQRLALLRATRAKIERENAVQAGDTLVKSEVGFAIRKGMSSLFSGLDHLCHVELPPDLKGMDEPMIEARLMEAIEQLKNNLRAEWTPLAGGAA